MVGLVIVSHSRKLASALVEFLGQMAPADLPVAIAWLELALTAANSAQMLSKSWKPFKTCIRKMASWC